MNTDKEKIINTEEIKDAAEQHRHPVLAVRNLLPSIVKENGEALWSKETIAATTATVIIVAGVVALYIYGAMLV